MIYKFKDLPKEMQDNLIAIESNCDYDWYDDCVSTFIQNMQDSYGISINSADIKFSGFGSQGDGASFTTDLGGIDALKFVLNSDFKFDFEREMYDILEGLTDVKNFYEEYTRECITLKVSRIAYQYLHENTVTALVDVSPPPRSGQIEIDSYVEEKEEKFVNALEKHFAEFVYQACKHLYNTLEIEWTSLFGKSTVLERLEKCTWKKIDGITFRLLTT